MSPSALAVAGLPITVVAADSEDPSRRARPRVRRKRRRRGAWAVVRWWPLFLSSLAVVVLFYHISKVGRIPAVYIGEGDGTAR